MKSFKYMGKYDLNPDSLPHNEHKPNAVKYKEIDDSKKLGIYMNLAALVILAVVLGLQYLRSGKIGFVGIYLSLLVMVPHEFLHGICFKENVYMYTNLRQGMLFVTGPETMSKGRFIFLSMFPNLVFGFIPYIIAMIFPNLTILGTFGAFNICAGAGDYYNVINTVTQVPKGGRVYMYGFNTYWYIPQNENDI